MIRLLLFFVLLAAASFGFAWLADRPGEIVLTWQGYRIETTLLVALGAVAVLTIVLIITWSILRFVFRIPAIMSLTARARRNTKGYAAVSKGMVAAAIGDAKVTEKAAREATKHLGDVPLAALLQAQSAQISGDRDKAIRTFNQMLENDETRVLGLRGLYLEACRNGDTAAAHVFAKEAYDLAPLPWAGQALLEYHATADQWAAALAVVESSIARKAIDKTSGNRQRGVLKTGIAMELAGREPDEALRIAREAIKLAPDLIPAYVTAGRLLARKGDIRRAGRILEDGWRVMAHPEIARAYLDMRPGDSAADRLARAKTLTEVYPDHIEARLTLARAALEARDFELARKTMDPVFDANAPRATVRACLLMADLEETEHGENGKVREWLGRATRAARDPMWISDGIVTDTWAPASPVTGKLDAFIWETPVEKLSAPLPPLAEESIEVLPPPGAGGPQDSAAQVLKASAIAAADDDVLAAKDISPGSAKQAAPGNADTDRTGPEPAATSAAPANDKPEAPPGGEDRAKDSSGSAGSNKPAPEAEPLAAAPDIPADKKPAGERSQSSPPDDPGPRKAQA